MLGAKGKLQVDQAYEYSEGNEMQWTVDGKTTKREHVKRDQFGPELVYFSDCILNDRKPEPSGEEGLLDVQIVEALYKSARTHRPVKLNLATKRKRPTTKQEIFRRGVKKPLLVHVKAPSQ